MTKTGIITTDIIFIICLRFPASVIGFPDIKRKYILSTFPQLHVFMSLVLYCNRPLQFPCINNIWFVFLPICFAIGSYFIYITCILWYLLSSNSSYEYWCPTGIRIRCCTCCLPVIRWVSLVGQELLTFRGACVLLIFCEVFCK
jgi:hypothetical protein